MKTLILFLLTTSTLHAQRFITSEDFRAKDTIPLFRIDTANYSISELKMESTGKRISLRGKNGREVAYAKDDSTWVIVDSAVALEIALRGIKENFKSMDNMSREIRTHKKFMEWLSNLPCGNFLFNQFYKSVYPDNFSIEIPNYNKQ